VEYIIIIIIDYRGILSTCLYFSFGGLMEGIFNVKVTPCYFAVCIMYINFPFVWHFASVNFAFWL